MRRKHHDLVAWQQGIELVKQVYALTDKFPQAEIYGLVAQMRRAAISIPSNIAEGAARQSRREFVQFLVIARGSLSELETHLRISIELGLCLPQPGLDALIDRLFSLLSGLIRSVGGARGAV